MDPQVGFVLLGTIDHDSEVRRGVRIADELYSLSERLLKVNRLDGTLAPVGSATLQEEYDLGWPGSAL